MTPCIVIASQVGRERMHFRPPEEQNDHKVTCGVHVDILQTVSMEQVAPHAIAAKPLSPGTIMHEVVACAQTADFINVFNTIQVLDHIQLSLEQAKVTANIITSGTGDWRFLDLVPVKAGKLEALEYVRRQHGFPISATVACGDSGNGGSVMMDVNIYAQASDLICCQSFRTSLHVIY